MLKVVEELFGDSISASAQPTFDELYDYAVALVNGADMATLFPAVHPYVQELGAQDVHYQALLGLLRLERQAQLEVPPIPAHFDFSYLAASRPVAHPWRIELGRLLINITEQALAAFTPAATQLDYRKSAGAQPVLAMTVAEPTSGVNVNITVHAAVPDRVAVTVGVTLPDRQWPQLKGIPVTLTMPDGAAITQATDPFGKTVFLGVSSAGLDNALIAIGPLAYWAVD